MSPWSQKTKENITPRATWENGVAARTRAKMVTGTARIIATVRNALRGRLDVE